MKKIIMFFVILFVFFNTNVFAEQIDNDFNIKFEKNISINDVFTIDLSNDYKKLKEKYNSDILFEYNIQNEQTINSPKLEKKFKSF
jgi:hypothetical protein